MATKKSSGSLPPISALLSDSFEVLRTNIIPFLLWSLITFGIAMIGVVLLGIVIIFSGLNFIQVLNGTRALTPQATQNLMFTGGGILLLFVILAAIWGTITQIGYITIASKKHIKVSYSKLISGSLRLVIPFLLVSFINFAIVLGGFFLFFIPGIVLSILVWFATYEVVLHNVRGMQAVRNSVRIVLDNFWGMIGRILVIIGIGFAINYLPTTQQSELAPVFLIMSMILGVAYNWYSQCYYVHLYQGARSAAVLTRPAPMKFVWTVSILGWILIAALSFALLRFITSGGINEIFRQMQPEQPIQNQFAADPQVQNQLTKSGQLLQQIQEVATTTAEPERSQQMQKLNDENIQGLQSSLEANPENQLLWTILCNSYSLPHTVGSEENQEMACSKAQEL